MTCSGIDVDPANPSKSRSTKRSSSCADADAGTGDVYLAPGFIDIQVNGFAAVDYNDPATPHDDIARSLQALFATGVTRFYPTVITGAPDDMVAALRNLSRAKDTLPDGDAIDGFHVEGPHICAGGGPARRASRAGGSGRPISTSSAAGRTPPTAASGS